MGGVFFISFLTHQLFGIELSDRFALPSLPASVLHQLHRLYMLHDPLYELFGRLVEGDYDAEFLTD